MKKNNSLHTKPNLKIGEGVSLIIPVFNEERTLLQIIEKCSSQPVVRQLVIVNDGSKDKTREILTKLDQKSKFSSKKPILTILHHKKNLGKGAAIITGLTKVLGKYVMVQDADLEYSPNEIINLFNKAEKTKSGIVFGTRSHNRKKGYILAQLGNWYLSLMFNTLFGLHLSDSYTCYKLLPRSVWLSLELSSTGFEIDSEMLSKLGIRGFSIEEVPITYFPRKYSEGKKINWKDLFRATWVALKIRTSSFNLR